MALVDEEVATRRIKTPANATIPLELWTAGRMRMEVTPDQPGMVGLPASASPAASTVTGSGTWFFRNNGDGKSQFCVRFPSGAVQILATEP